MTRYFFLLAVACGCAISSAESPATSRGVVDRSVPMQELRTDFGLVDGPAWDGMARLFVPDVKAKQLHTFSINKATDPWQVRLPNSGAISGTVFQAGKLFLANNGVSEIQVLVDNAPPTTLAKLEPTGKPNDLVVRKDGNVYVTITSKNQILRVNPAGETSVAVSGVEAPNGITMSPDGNTLYVSLFKSGKLIKAAVNGDGTVGAAQDFAQLPETSDGFRGDGMCVDRAGNVYATGADSLHIFDANGTVIDTIKTPSRPINCTYGGSDARTLYIATFGGLYSQQMNRYAALPKLAASDLGGVKLTTDIAYANVGPRRLLLDLYQPESKESPLPGIVLVHGGGWLKGDRSKFHSLAVKLAQKNYVVASIEYRLGHEAPFPAAIHDCNAATKFIRSRAAEFGIDADRIGAVGGSAGGHLVGLMATASENAALHYVASESDVSSRLQAAVVMAGPMQIASGMVADKSHDLAKPSNAVQWIGATIDENPVAYQLADAHEAISSDDPAILFVRGSLDNPTTDEPSILKLKEVGVETHLVIHDGAKHGHWNQADWVDRVAEDIDQFLKKHLE